MNEQESSTTLTGRLDFRAKQGIKSHRMIRTIAEILDSASANFVMTDPRFETDSFLSVIFNPMALDPDFDEERIADDVWKKVGEDPTYLLEGVTVLVAAKCVSASKCAIAGHRDEAWDCLVQAMRLTTMMSMAGSMNEGNRNSMAILGSDAAHRENREMKAQAIAHYRAHIEEYSSKNAAAAAIAGKIVPVTFRTVLFWLKNEAPAGKK